MSNDEVVARVRALEARWTECLTAYQCPSCLAPLNFGGFCDHEEGYHHALSDLRAALDPERGEHRISADGWCRDCSTAAGPVYHAPADSWRAEL